MDPRHSTAVTEKAPRLHCPCPLSSDEILRLFAWHILTYLGLSWLISSHRILFILPTKHYSFYEPITLILSGATAGEEEPCPCSSERSTDRQNLLAAASTSCMHEDNQSPWHHEFTKLLRSFTSINQGSPNRPEPVWKPRLPVKPVHSQPPKFNFPNFNSKNGKFPKENLKNTSRDVKSNGV
jgi:hypothetical protein